jgi:hypothetical protein
MITSVKTNRYRMKPKRAPGAGRKPQGEYKGKTATLTTRIAPDTRTALEKAAKETGRSLSQEIENRLRRSIASDYGSGEEKHNRAFGRLTVELAGMVEAVTGERWRTDPFAHRALRAALNIILDRLAPTGELKVPPLWEAAAMGWAEREPSLGEQVRTPEAAGNSAAMSVWLQLKTVEKPTDLSSGRGYADVYYAYPDIRRDLGIPSRKESAR